MAAYSQQQQQGEGDSQATDYGLWGQTSQQEQGDRQSSHRNVASCVTPKCRKPPEHSENQRRVSVEAG